MLSTFTAKNKFGMFVPVLPFEELATQYEIDMAKVETGSGKRSGRS